VRLRRAARCLGLGLLLAACSPSPAPLRTATPHASPSPTATAAPTAEPTPAPTPTPVPPPPGVILLVLENHSYEDVVGNAGAPNLNALAQHYGLATHAYAYTHPSLPNYLDLVAGSSFGISSDCTDCNVAGQTSLADQLTAHGLSWGAYMEDMPSPCFTGDSVDDSYAKKHNPFLYFDQIRDDPAQCRRDQPFGAFYPALDASALPSFSLVVPNLCDDGHNCALSRSDAWVGGFVDHVTGSAWFRGGGVLIVTFDEGVGDAGCCNGAAGGHVATWVASAATPPGARLDTPLSHAGILRSVELLDGLPLLGGAQCACSGDLLALLGR
jgi:hypothetical protein